jgi:hypothetical protein
VEAADTLGETDYAAVCSGNCDLLVLGGFSTYMPLECAVTVRRSSADGLPTATWLGAARIGDWMTYGEGWYLIRVDDSGHGHVDRLGIDVVRSADANVFDGRCGAWNVPPTALLAGDFVIRSVKQTHLQAP